MSRRSPIETMPLAQANEALLRLRDGRLKGAAVLMTRDRPLLTETFHLDVSRTGD